MDESVVIVIAVVALLGLGSGFYCLERVRRKRALYRWAADNDYKLISYVQPMLTEATPFPFTVSKAQQIFRISVLQKDGHSRSGWLLLGSGWFGSPSEEADIRWDV